MGDVILFRPRTGQNRTNSGAAQTGAQIVFFTGVRYARMPEAIATPDAGDLGAPPAGGVGRARSGRRRRGA